MTYELELELLRKFADNMEARFLSPVYLVGSWRRRYQDATDIDVVMVMDEARMKRLFKSIQYNDRRYQFNRKQKLEAECFIHAWDIDFKVQSRKEFESFTGDRLKLGRYVAFEE